MKRFIIQKLLGLIVAVVSLVVMIIFKGDVTGLVATFCLGLFFMFTKHNYLN